MPVRILIADDNASVRTAMRRVLECTEERWEIIEAENGQEAVAKSQEFEPSLVILDLVMPKKNGLSAAREIAGFLPDVPILMHTLYSSRQVELEAGKAGIRRIVPKSDSSAFVAAVEDLLHRHPKTSVELAEPSESYELTPIGRTEDRIRELCAQLFAAKDDQTNAQILVRLREALHRHIEHLRARVAEYPAVLKRRKQSDIQLRDELPSENIEKKPASASSVIPMPEADPPRLKTKP